MARRRNRRPAQPCRQRRTKVRRSAHQCRQARHRGEDRHRAGFCRRLNRTSARLESHRRRDRNQGRLRPLARWETYVLAPSELGLSPNFQKTNLRAAMTEIRADPGRQHQAGMTQGSSAGYSMTAVRQIPASRGVRCGSNPVSAVMSATRPLFLRKQTFVPDLAMSESAKSGLEHLAPLRPRFGPPEWSQTQI